MKLQISNQGFSINGSKIPGPEIERLAYQFVKQYKANYVMIIETDEQTTFEKYIQGLDLLHVAVDSLRDHVALQSYERKYQRLPFRKQVMVKQKVKKNFVEWTKEEKRLEALMLQGGK